MSNCYACDLINGQTDLPGGRIHQTRYWVVEHCTGPLGVGTVIVKPLRHCLHMWELTADESAELGILLREVTEVIRRLLTPDQIYVCLWAHGGWQLHHLHFVVQPVWQHLSERFPKPGPRLPAAMFGSGEAPAGSAVEAFCERASGLLHYGTAE
jgi:diadenosine tetraphosphate (Ap4A) HIT family hydrolase